MPSKACRNSSVSSSAQRRCQSQALFLALRLVLVDHCGTKIVGACWPWTTATSKLAPSRIKHKSLGNRSNGKGGVLLIGSFRKQMVFRSGRNSSSSKMASNKLAVLSNE